MTAKYTDEMYELFPELKRYMNQSYPLVYEAHLKRIGKRKCTRVRGPKFTLESGYLSKKDQQKGMNRVLPKEYSDYFMTVFSSDSEYNIDGKNFAHTVADNMSEMFIKDVINGGWDHYEKVAPLYLKLVKDTAEQKRLDEEEKKKQKRLAKTGTATLPIEEELPDNFVEVFPPQKLGVAEMIMIDGVVYRLEKV